MRKLRSMNLNTKIVIRDSKEAKKRDLLIAFAEVTPLYCSKAGKIASLKYGYMLSNDYYIFRTWYNKNIRSGRFVFFNELEYKIERVVNLSNSYRVIDIIACLKDKKDEGDSSDNSDLD